MLSLEVWILIASVVGFIPLYLDLLWRVKEHNKIDFKLQRFQDFLKPPNQGTIVIMWSIRILHPNKPIKRCSVSYNGVKLLWSNNPNEPPYEKFIDAMSGDNMRVPKGTEKDDAIIVVRDGKKIIQKPIKFKDIPIVQA